MHYKHASAGADTTPTIKSGESRFGKRHQHTKTGHMKTDPSEVVAVKDDHTSHSNDKTTRISANSVKYLTQRLQSMASGTN